MATKDVNAKQKEIIARKLGYEGPMQGFDEFLKSDPALAQRYGLVLDKFMARGGMARKYAEGGAVKFSVSKDSSEAEKVKEYTNLLNQGFSNEQIRTAAEAQFGKQTDSDWAYLTGKAAEGMAGNKKQDFQPKDIKTDAAGKPVAPTIENIQPVTMEASSDEFISSAGAPSQAAQVTAQQAGPAATAAAPEKAEFEEITATTTAADTAEALKKLAPAQGTVSEQAQVTAETMEPTDTALAEAKAAEGVARQVQAPAARKAEEGEMVPGPAVDMTRVETELAKAQAAQGTVTEEMTVQGQLNKLLADFDAKQPPPWAAASMRSVTAILAERGLGASSLAGQAIIQATMESALPIATADAATYREMESQNLSNRQQTAMLLAQQRAQFLGQEFDQEFQTRVLNAAKVADIANMNFSANTQIALENARLAQTMDLANLSNKQAVLMAQLAQISNLELTNLNNRQQAAVLNAQAFLQMDMQNLANEQQTEMFKAQSTIQSIFTDAAAENAAKQFNSASKLQNDQFFSSLAAQVAQFNAQQQNAMTQFNVEQANAVATFNAQQQNIRDQFNAENSRIIAQSNAEWRRQITLTNTQAEQRAAEINAQNALEITKLEYNNEWQSYRDDIEMAWKTAENEAERDNQIALQVISKEANIEAAKIQADAIKYQTLGQAVSVIAGKTDILDTGAKLIKDIFGGGSVTSETEDLTEEDWNEMFKTDEAEDGFDYWGGSD